MIKRCLTFIMVTLLAVSSCFVVGCDKGKDDSKGNVTTPRPAPTAAPTKDPAVVDFSLKTMDAETLFNNSKVQGRTKVVDYQAGKGIALDFTASSVEFRACCEGDVSAVIHANPMAIDANRRPVLFINVYVDGVLQGTRDLYALTQGSHELVLGKGLAKGTHTFMIERQNEAEYGDLYVNSVSFSGEFDARPEESNVYIEVIGDSITTGYGNLYPNNTGGAKDPLNNPRSSYYQDGTRAYACLAMKKLGADYSIIAQQGIGAGIGWQPHTMLETYEKTCYQRGRNDAWGFEKQPDLVIINLGSNDMSCEKGWTEKQIQDGFVSLIKMVRKNNPDAKILWAFGGVTPVAAPLVEAAVKEAGGEAAGIYAFTDFVNNNEGGIGHPVVSAHEQNAELLVKEVKKILGL